MSLAIIFYLSKGYGQLWRWETISDEDNKEASEGRWVEGFLQRIWTSIFEYVTLWNYHDCYLWIDKYVSLSGLESFYSDSAKLFVFSFCPLPLLTERLSIQPSLRSFAWRSWKLDTIPLLTQLDKNLMHHFKQSILLQHALSDEGNQCEMFLMILFWFL